MWAKAVRAEVDHIPEDRAAFLFALDAIGGVACLALSQALVARWARINRFFSSPCSGSAHMLDQTSVPTKIGHIGIICAIGAVGLGLAYLFAAGAPMYMLAINAGALILGLAVLLLLTRLPNVASYARGIATWFMSSALWLPALSGTAVDGASRWVTLGSLAVQPSLILVPVIVLIFARERGPITTVAMLITALAMALQPDRAMAGVLMSGLMALVIMHRDRFGLVALAASVAAFAVAMTSPDRLPAVPHVDQVLYTAFDVHLLAGLAVAAGAALLLAPALYGLRVRTLDRTTCVTFATVWLAIIVAAALGNYPTPVVGYGGSAILGYVFSLGILCSATLQTAATPTAQPGTMSRPRNIKFLFGQHYHA